MEPNTGRDQRPLNLKPIFIDKKKQKKTHEKKIDSQTSDIKTDRQKFKLLNHLYSTEI